MDDNRLEAARAALANARLSGQPVDTETQQVMERWGRGEVGDDALRARAAEIKRTAGGRKTR